MDPFDFDWLDAPARSSLESAVEELQLLGAIEGVNHQLTELGHLIADLQIDPGMARMITFACHQGQGRAAAELAGLFGVSSSVFWRGSDDETRQASDQSKLQFESRQSDIISIYRAYRQWSQLDTKAARKWCLDNYVNNKSMNMAKTTRNEICCVLERSPVWKKSANQNAVIEKDEDIGRLVAQAFVLNVAVQVDRMYLALRADVLTWIHPGSNFFALKSTELPQVVVFQNILRTSRTFAVNITTIEWDWIRRDNEVLHAFYQEKASHAKTCPVRIDCTSRYVLRTLLGPSNSRLDKLNASNCYVTADYDSQVLVAWCKPGDTDVVER